MIKPHTSLLAIFCFVALIGYAGMSSQAEPKLVTGPKPTLVSPAANSYVPRYS
jgi:hypothetical protein